jgi:carbon storage regulator
MLVLSRKKNEGIVINNDITITVVETRGDKVRLGIVCPKEVPVHRQEVYEAIHGWVPRRWPRSPEERAFVQAVQGNPDDEGLRLVFADWLEERGDPLGELLRIQCALVRRPAQDPRRWELEQRERVLWQEHLDDWISLPQVLRSGPPGPRT